MPRCQGQGRGDKRAQPAVRMWARCYFLLDKHQPPPERVISPAVLLDGLQVMSSHLEHGNVLPVPDMRSHVGEDAEPVRGEP